MTEAKFVDHVRRVVNQYGGPTLAAKQLRSSQPYLSRLLAGKKRVTPALARQLGYEQVITYKRIRKERHDG